MKNKIEFDTTLMSEVFLPSQIELYFDLYGRLAERYDSIYLGEKYIIAYGSKVALVAHLDTVHSSAPTSIVKKDGKYRDSINGLGADDRAGVMGILQVINQLEDDELPTIIFCEDEEIGGIGSSQLVEDCIPLDVNCFIELDRAYSNDAVYYDYTNEDFAEIMSQYGFVEAYGSFTDICTLTPHYDAIGVNLSIGYYLQHTKSEYLVEKEYLDTVNKVVDMCKDERLLSNFFKAQYDVTDYLWNWRKYGGYDFDKGYDDDNEDYDKYFDSDDNWYMSDEEYAQYLKSKYKDFEEDGFCTDCGVELTDEEYQYKKELENRCFDCYDYKNYK